MDVNVNREEMPKEDDDSEEVEMIPLRSTQPEQFTSVSSSNKGKKRSRELGALTEKSSSKKAKKTSEKKVSSMLKKLIEELLTDVPVFTAGENLEEVSENSTSI